MDGMTWEQFTELFREQYIPQIEVERLTSEFLSLVQTTELVNEITDKFLERSLFCPEYIANEKDEDVPLCRSLKARDLGVRGHG